MPHKRRIWQGARKLQFLTVHLQGKLTGTLLVDYQALGLEQAMKQQVAVPGMLCGQALQTLAQFLIVPGLGVVTVGSSAQPDHLE